MAESFAHPEIAVMLLELGGYTPMADVYSVPQAYVPDVFAHELKSCIKTQGTTKIIAPLLKSLFDAVAAELDTLNQTERTSVTKGFWSKAYMPPEFFSAPKGLRLPVTKAWHDFCNDCKVDGVPYPAHLRDFSEVNKNWLWRDFYDHPIWPLLSVMVNTESDFCEMVAAMFAVIVIAPEVDVWILGDGWTQAEWSKDRLEPFFRFNAMVDSL
jgi:hypothetical protein